MPLGIPLQERIESVADEADLEEVYNTERQLLYVACTVSCLQNEVSNDEALWDASDNGTCGDVAGIEVHSDFVLIRFRDGKSIKVFGTNSGAA